MTQVSGDMTSGEMTLRRLDQLPHTHWKKLRRYLTHSLTFGHSMKIICTVVEETNINDPRSYEHYPNSSWNKAWKKVDFFLQCQYNIKESSDKNNENHYRGNYYLIQYQIQRANYMNI